jgi:hypothetical protein
MTTRTFSTVIEHTSDATFRAWALEVSDALAFVGMPKSADTGQINLATAARPGTNTAAGYEIRYVDDALHATAPIYIKIEYGTGSAATRPAMWITVGTGSNGSGTITGVLLARQTLTCASTPSTSVPSPTYACRVGGQFGFAWKSGVLDLGAFPSMGAFLISRTTDDDGADTAAGVSIYALSPGSYVEATSKLFSGSAYSTGSNRQYCMVPYGLTASLVGADNQAFRHYAAFPQIRPVVACVTVLASEVPVGSTISVTPIGATPRTYISTGFAGRASCVNGTAAQTLAMIWE